MMNAFIHMSPEEVKDYNGNKSTDVIAENSFSDIIKNVLDNPIVVNDSPQVEVVSTQQKKRGRPKKTTSVNGETVVTSSEPEINYLDSYDETTNMLRNSIMQIDILSADVKQTLDNVKASKTLKNKYNYISELSSTSSSLLGTKISAIREMNKTITDCHNLEMRKLKELKEAQSEQTDDKYLMDMYNAYLNTPISTSPISPMSFGSSDALNMGNPINDTDMVINNNMGYSDYINNISPEQNRMLLGDNPNIETVVVFDQNTGNRMFDVIDTTTGQSVPNYPRPNSILLEETHINPRTGIAKNSNVNQKWRVIVVGEPTPLMNY